MKILRLVIKETVSENEINSTAQTNNWRLDKVILPAEKNPYEKIWLSSDGRTSIHYIEDFLINIRYIAIKGEDLDKIVSQIRSSLDIYNHEEILDLIEKATDSYQYIHAVYHAGAIATQEFDPEIFTSFKIALAHPDPEVRMAAIFASAYAAWPEFREPLEYLQYKDTEPAVRAYASLMIASHIRHSWNTDVKQDVISDY